MHQKRKTRPRQRGKTRLPEGSHWCGEWKEEGMMVEKQLPYVWWLSWRWGCLSPGHPSALWGCRCTPRRGSARRWRCCPSPRSPPEEPPRPGWGALPAAGEQGWLFSHKLAAPWLITQQQHCSAPAVSSVTCALDVPPDPTTALTSVTQTQQALCTSPLCAAIFTTVHRKWLESAHPHHSKARQKTNKGL